MKKVKRTCLIRAYILVMSNNGHWFLILIDEIKLIVPEL